MINFNTSSTIYSVSIMTCYRHHGKTRVQRKHSQKKRTKKIAFHFNSFIFYFFDQKIYYENP